LWFLDRGTAGTKRADQVLFIDARSIFRQVDRAHREFTDEQIELLANIVRVYRGQDPEFTTGTNELFSDRFPDSAYADINGLCRVASVAEIAEQGFSLNPGRYVGTEVEARRCPRRAARARRACRRARGKRRSGAVAATRTLTAPRLPLTARDAKPTSGGCDRGRNQ
ncbi:MAG: N-6 DNA methylase, partial [Solirubrobacteraceae bacterium]